MGKKKVLIVGSSLKDKGGIVTVINNLLNSKLNNYYELQHLATYINSNRINQVIFYLKSLIKFLANVLFNKPDLIYVHVSYKGSFYRKALIILIANLFRVPVFMHVHGSKFEVFYNELNYFQRKFSTYILKICEKVIVLSDYWKKFFSNIVPKEKIEIIYNGVNFIDYKYNKCNDDPICLFLGRLGERKGTYDLIKAISILKTKGVYSNFILAGDGEVEQVKKYADTLGVKNNTEFLGWIGKEKKIELLSKADILVLPSYNEGLPMAILEAMNYGLSIVSTYVGGIPEVVTVPENGYLVHPGEVESLANCLEKLIKDHSLRKKIGIENIKKVKEKYNLENEVSSLIKLIEETLSRK